MQASISGLKQAAEPLSISVLVFRLLHCSQMADSRPPLVQVDFDVEDIQEYNQILDDFSKDVVVVLCHHCYG